MPQLQPTPVSEALVHEREALEELQHSEGWKIFVDRVLQEHVGTGFFARIGTAVQSGDPTKPKIVHATSIEIQAALKWVPARIEFLTKKGA